MDQSNSKNLHVDLLTPDKKAFSGEVRYVKAPGTQGYFGILYNHAPLLATLQIGEVMLEEDDDKKHYFAVSGGFLEVMDNHVRVLAETAEAAEEINVTRAEDAKERAEKYLASQDKNTNFGRARIALFRAINRIRIAGKT